MSRLRLGKQNDGIGIVCNFFDFLSYLYLRNMHPQNGGSTLLHAIHLCNRHMPLNKNMGLDVNKLIR